VVVLEVEAGFAALLQQRRQQQLVAQQQLVPGDVVVVALVVLVELAASAFAGLFVPHYFLLENSLVVALPFVA